MKITHREMSLGLLTLGAILIGLTWWIVNSNLPAYRNKAVEIEKLRQQIAFHKNAIKMQENWIGELNELQKDLRVFDSQLRSVAPELRKTIQTISTKYGLEIIKVSPREEHPTGDLFELAINCTWNGKLESMVDFLAELQQQGVRYDVRTLTVKPLGKNTGKLSGSMLIYCSYTKKPNAGKQPDSTPAAK